MITEKELKDRCTPEIIKKMIELAEGFESTGYYSIDYNGVVYRSDAIEFMRDVFPLLIHRAVEGWNKRNINVAGVYFLAGYIENHKNNNKFHFQDYQSTNLTQAECAMLHCLLDIYEGEKK